MLRRNRIGLLVCVGIAVTRLGLLAAADDETTKALATLKAVGREGASNDAAGLAWKALVRQGGPALMPTLEAIDDNDPTAANWLRTAIDAIVQAEKAAGRKLDAAELEAFATNTQKHRSARRLAYELLVAQDPGARDRLLPGFLNDPNTDLRRDAVAAELRRLEKATGPAAKDDLVKLLGFARDKDQVEAITARLDKEYKTTVSLTEHFGFLTHWHVIGPFDCSQGKALTTSYPPEQKVTLGDRLGGKGGVEVGWKPYVTRDRYGVVNLNKLIGPEHDAAAYATATVVAEKATPAEIRVASPNAVQIFLNGKKLFEREEYHHGSNMDHHVGKGVLNAGPNVVVLKICQNNQKETWAQNWQFQLRICDSTGGLIPGVTQLIPNGAQPASVKLGFVPPSPENEGKK